MRCEREEQRDIEREEQRDIWREGQRERGKLPSNTTYIICYYTGYVYILQLMQRLLFNNYYCLQETTQKVFEWTGVTLQKSHKLGVCHLSIFSNEAV